MPLFTLLMPSKDIGEARGGVYLMFCSALFVGIPGLFYSGDDSVLYVRF